MDIKEIIRDLEINLFIDDKHFNETIEFNQQTIDNASEEEKKEIEYLDFKQNHWNK
jgi:hypothetical protein